MLYRFKKITDEYTTHCAQPPEGDPTWFEHCTLDDGYTYVTCSGPVPEQDPIIEFELITPPAQFFNRVRSASVHVALMEKRAAAGKHMREDGHIVKGSPGEIAGYRQRMLEMFGIGGG